MTDRNGADPGWGGDKKELRESRKREDDQDPLWEKKSCFQ